MVEVDGSSFEQMARRLREIADHLDKGYTDGVVEHGDDGTYEFHVYAIQGAK